MLDLETFGNNPRSVIVSIGAVAFDPMGNEPVNELPAFYRNVDAQSCMDAGLIADGSTIMWWLNQSEAARKSLSNPAPIQLKQALEDFQDWVTFSGYTATPTDLELWAHATFDPVIMRSALDAFHLTLPWKYRNTRDIRTLVGLAKQVGLEIPESGGNNSNPEIHHNALDDTRYQIGYVRQLYQAVIGWYKGSKAA